MLNGNWGIYKVRTLVDDSGNVALEQDLIKYLEDDDIIPAYFIMDGCGWDINVYRYPYFRLSINGYYAIGGFLSYDLVQNEIITIHPAIVTVKYITWRKLKVDYRIQYTFE